MESWQWKVLEQGESRTRQTAWGSLGFYNRVRKADYSASWLILLLAENDLVASAPADVL